MRLPRASWPHLTGQTPSGPPGYTPPPYVPLNLPRVVPLRSVAPASSFSGPSPAQQGANAAVSQASQQSAQQAANMAAQQAATSTLPPAFVPTRATTPVGEPAQGGGGLSTGTLAVIVIAGIGLLTLWGEQTLSRHGG